MSLDNATRREEFMEQEYKYTECGLDNVVIRGIEKITDDVGDQVYCIPNVRGLHRAIAHGIITQASGISERELRFLRTEMGLTQERLAQILRVARVTVTRWETGKERIGRHVECVVRMLAVDKLGVQPEMSIEEIAKRCGWKSKPETIRIDGSDPQKYRPLAA